MRELIIERVKAGWSRTGRTKEFKYAIKREHAQFSKNNLHSIKSEIVEHVSEDDPRFDKLFYLPKGVK